MPALWSLYRYPLAVRAEFQNKFIVIKILIGIKSDSINFNIYKPFEEILMTENSGRIIIITEKSDILPVFKNFAAETGISIPEDGNDIITTDYLREKANSLGTLSWMKKEILDYIKCNGYPLMIISDLRINSGMENDSDGLKVLKTLLLSYIIITHSESFRDVKCNLFILAGPDDYRRLRNDIKEPKLLLNHIRTNDSKVNEVIERLKSDPSAFQKNFNIFLCSTGNGESQLKSELNTFLNMIKAREKLSVKLRKYEKPASPENSSAIPADIVYRLDTGYYVNGEISGQYAYHGELNTGEIYIIGNFTSFTRVDVIERLLALVKSGPDQNNRLSRKPVLVLNIPGRSVIDVTIPVTLAQLLSKEFCGFKSVRIKTTMEQARILQQSRGYSMIQRNLVLYND